MMAVYGGDRELTEITKNTCRCLLRLRIEEENLFLRGALKIQILGYFQ